MQARRGGAPPRALLESETDESTIEAIVDSLGRVASAWAWQAMGPKAEAAGQPVREIASRALVGAFLRHTGDVRARIGKALLMTEHPITVELLDTARGSADASTRAELDTLSRKISRQRSR